MNFVLLSYAISPVILVDVLISENCTHELFGFSDLSSAVIISHGELMIGIMSIELSLVAMLGVLLQLSKFTQGFIRHSTCPRQFFCLLCVAFAI